MSNGKNVIIYENVKLGKNVEIGNNVVIHPNTIIGNGVVIQDNAVIGKMPRSSAMSGRKVSSSYPPCEIGEGTLIGTSAIIYTGTKIGKECFIGDLASIREDCDIKNNSIIGRGTIIELKTNIGANVKIQANCHITGYMTIEDNVFIGPSVATMNDKYMDAVKMGLKGPHIKQGAKIGSNSTLLPAITIGKGSIVGAGAVVTKDVPDYKVVMGVPAVVVKDVPPELRGAGGNIEK